MLGPSGAVTPDGFPIALRRRTAGGEAVAPSRPALTSPDVIEVRPGEAVDGLRTFQVVPRPGVREVRLRAQDEGLKAEARFAVGPPAAKVELSITPPAPVKGRDTHAELSIRMQRPDGSTDPEASPPVLRANVGAVTGLTQVGPGLYRATYQIPDTGYPEVAIIVALSPWPHPQSIYGAFGRLLVPLSGSGEVPGKVEPNAEMSIEVAGVRFGPVPTGRDGRFKVPVVVPPGYRYGTGYAVDRLGNRRKSRVDLHLPPTNQLACVASPTRLPADGSSRARILCAATDPKGNPETPRKVALSARLGAVAGPRVLENGMLEWIYTAPRTLPEAPDELLATWKQAGPSSRAELKMELEQGPASGLELSAAERVVHAGGELHLEARVSDALGRPRAGTRLVPSAPGGAFSPPEEGAPGRLALRWTAPVDREGPVQVCARAFGPPGLEPAQLLAWIEEGELRVGVTDLAGLPVPRQPLRVDGREVQTGEDGTLSLGPAQPGRVELVHGQWPGLRLTVWGLDGARALFPASRPPGSREACVKVELAPPARVIVHFGPRSPGQVSWWLEDDKGHRLAGRRVDVALPTGAHRPAVSAKDPQSISVGSGPVTVTDVQTGTAGVLP